MVRRRSAVLHIGLNDGSGDVIAAALEQHGHALQELGVRKATWPCSAGLSASVDRTHPGRDTLVMSRPLLATSGRDYARRLVSAWDGLDVHIVLTCARASGSEPVDRLAAALEIWSPLASGPDRVHLILADDDAATWRSFGRIAGFGTASLEVPPPSRLQVATTADRRPEIERLRRASAAAERRAVPHPRRGRRPRRLSPTG